MPKTPQKYKIKFVIAYPYVTGNRTVSFGQMHYVGNTIKEAVDKVSSHLKQVEARGGYCTSMYFMRGLPGQRSIKWKHYLEGCGIE